MGFSFRKSFRILPGIRISLSRRGPRLSVGIPGVRASVGMNGKARIYGGEGPLRYQKTVTLGAPQKLAEKNVGLLAFIKRLFDER